MNSLFLLLFLASFVCLIIGLVKPTIFSRFISGEITRKKIGLIFGIMIIIFFVLFVITIDASKQKQSSIKESMTEQKIESTQLDTEKQTKGDINEALTKQQAKQVAEEKAKSVPIEYKSALKKAISYANTMHMSKQGVYDQLVSEYGEKFSAVAAQYAIDNVEANWNENALIKAKNYQNTVNMSPGAILDQLTSKYGEKFTKAEASYAIQHLND